MWLRGEHAGSGGSGFTCRCKKLAVLIVVDLALPVGVKVDLPVSVDLD